MEKINLDRKRRPEIHTESKVSLTVIVSEIEFGYFSAYQRGLKFIKFWLWVWVP